MTPFDKALSFVFGNEGGYSNDPDDRGGATNLGITQSTLDRARRQMPDLPEKVEDLTRERYLNDYVYMSQYLDAWRQWHYASPGFQGVIDIVQQLVRDRPGFLHRVLEEQHDEATIEYLYPEFGSRRISAYREPFAQRSNNVVRFWSRMWERAKGEPMNYQERGWIDEELVADL